MSSEGASTLGVRLAEMDSLLRDIQAELMPGREPAPAVAAVAAPDAPAGDPSPATAPASAPSAPAARTPASAPSAPAARTPASDQQVGALTDLATHLLASMRELLAGYERVLGRSSAALARRRRAASDARDVTLSAGPFASMQALREFEQGVSGLPGVREVAVQAYEGSDRAIIEVRLDHPSP